MKLTELKNRKERMEYLQDNENWQPVYADTTIKQLHLLAGERLFIRVLVFSMETFDRTPKWNFGGQYEVIDDGTQEYLESRSNSQICDILSKKATK